MTNPTHPSAVAGSVAEPVELATLGEPVTVGNPLPTVDAAVAAALASNASVPVVDGGSPYVLCPAATDTPLGPTGAVGDVLATLLINPGATPTAVTIKDGGNTVWVEPATAFTANVTRTMFLGWTSRVGAWHVILTGSPIGLATGRFTA